MQDVKMHIKEEKLSLGQKEIEIKHRDLGGI